MTHTALFHRDRLRRIEAFEKFARDLSPEINLTRHRYGGSGFNYHNIEIAHIHGNALVDILLTRERATVAVSQTRAQPHHLCGPSAWVSIWMRSDRDFHNATELFSEAITLENERLLPTSNQLGWPRARKRRRSAALQIIGAKVCSARFSASPTA